MSYWPLQMVTLNLRCWGNANGATPGQRSHRVAKDTQGLRKLQGISWKSKIQSVFLCTWLRFHKIISYDKSIWYLFSFEVGRFPGHPVHRAQQKSERKMPRDGCDQRCLVSQNSVKTGSLRNVARNTVRGFLSIKQDIVIAGCWFWWEYHWKELWEASWLYQMYLFHWKPVTGASQLLKSKSWSINDTSISPNIMREFLDGFLHLGDIESYFLNTVTGSRNDTEVDWKLWAIRSDMDNEVDKAKSCFI